ncbi:hypothetical protein [Dehalococcoides mccartyi]|uniref:hypothetical protein n=1 Tax=Dehalococcoides mccartyi TaxID=61435 RepID=UPI0026E992FF|nr:hypothetical protein [Dehalococcoides mccartyi]
MNKKAILVSLMLVCFIMITGCSKAQAAPQELATETQKIVEQVKKQDNSVFDDIQHNIDMVSDLKDEIEASTGSDKQKLLNNVISDLEKVTASYEELANKKEDIRKYLLKKVTALEGLQAQVRTETTRLNTQHNEYTTALKTFNDPDPEIVRTRSAALKQAIGYVDMQLTSDVPDANLHPIRWLYVIFRPVQGQPQPFSVRQFWALAQRLWTGRR